MKILLILGTARKGRQSEKVAKYLKKIISEQGHNVDYIDVADYPITSTDNTVTSDKAKEYSGKVKAADGIIVVSPEYNHSFPGELKLLLDMVYKEYAKKAFGIAGVSAGPIGGARMVEQLRTVAVEFRMLPMREALYFPMVQNLFDESGDIKDPAYTERVKKFLDDMQSYVSLKK